MVIVLASSAVDHRWCNGYRALALSAVDRGFKPRSDQTEDSKNGICGFSANHMQH